MNRRMTLIKVNPQPPKSAINFFFEGDDTVGREVWQYQIPVQVVSGLIFNKSYVWGDCPYGKSIAVYIDGEWYWEKVIICESKS